MIVFLLPEMVK